MNKVERIFIYILALVFIYFLAKIALKDPLAGTTKETITNVYDSAQKHITVNVKPPDITINVAPPAKIDSAAVVADYYKKRVYVDTIKDTALTAYITDTIDQNKLTGRAFSYRWTNPVATIIEREKTLNYGPTLAGGLFFVGTKNSFAFGPLMQYRARSEIDVGLGKSITSKDVYISATIPFRKLFKKKAPQ